MTRAYELSRRGFLAALGLGAATVPVFRPGRLMAQGMPPQQKRFVFMFTPNGMRPASWHPTAGRSETDFTLRGVLAPLAAEPWMKTKLLVLQGLYNQSADNGGPGSPHVRGIGSLLTGSAMLAGGFMNNGGTSGFASGPSLDQLLATSLHARSLQLGVHLTDAYPSSALSYAGSNRPLPAVTNPYQVFNDVFGGAGADAVRLRNRRQSVLDFSLQDLAAVHSELGPEDRGRLEAHTEALHTIETDLAAEAASSCVGPSIPDAPSGANWYNDPSRQPDVVQRHIRILTAAFACGSARIATLQFGSASSVVSHPFLDYPSTSTTGITETFHGLSHAAQDAASCPSAATAGCAPILAARGKLDTINTWHATQFANLMRAFEAVQYADGTTMLDHTVIVWGNELGDGSTHTHHDVPFVMAGSCGGYFRTGRYLQYNDASHSQLLVSLSNAMGRATDSVGNPAYGRGPLAGLR